MTEMLNPNSVIVNELDFDGFGQFSIDISLLFKYRHRVFNDGNA